MPSREFLARTIAVASIPLGIDFGTVYSRVAYYDRDREHPVMIPNAEDHLLTPSVVAIEGGQTIVGQVALHMQASGHTKTVAFFRQHLGKAEFSVHLSGRTFNPTELAALVFANLKHDAEDYLGVPVHDVVIAISPYLSTTQRAAFVEAGELADLHVLGLIPEPIAAVLAHGLQPTGKRERIFVCDIGGGSTDVSVVACEDGNAQVLAFGGENYLGGLDFDHMIATWLAGQIADGDGADADDFIRRLMPEVESAKRRLSAYASAIVSFPQEGKWYTAELHRDVLESLCRGLVERIERVCNKVLEDADLSWNDLTRVILAGGSTRLPMIWERLERMIDRAIISQGHLEDAISLGSAIQAAYVQDGMSDSLSIPVPEVTLAQATSARIPFEMLDAITIVRGKDPARIELCVGDLTNMRETEAVDVLVISAYPDDYTPLPGSLIGALHDKGLSVAQLARRKEVDLRAPFSCWISQEFSRQARPLHFMRLLCFEPLVRGKPPELVGDIFRSLAPFVGGTPPVRTVAMPLVAGGYQGFPPEQMLRLIVEAASHWMTVGLPLSCLKIVSLPGKTPDGVRAVFKDLSSRLSSRQEAQKRKHRFDLFLSYSRLNTEDVDWFEQMIKERRPELRIFLDRQRLNCGAAWQDRFLNHSMIVRKLLVFFRQRTSRRSCVLKNSTLLYAVIGRARNLSWLQSICIRHSFRPI